MNPIFRRFWIIGLIFSSVIDIATTYLLIQKDLFIHISEGSYIVGPLIDYFGAEIGLFVIAPIIVSLFIWMTLRLCDVYWPKPGTVLIGTQTAFCYFYLSAIFFIKFFVSALNTVSLLKLREVI